MLVPEVSEDDDPDLLLVFGRELISNCKPVDGRICDLLLLLLLLKLNHTCYVVTISSLVDKWNRSEARLSYMEDATSFV